MFKRKKLKRTRIRKSKYYLIILAFVSLLTSCAYQNQLIENYKKGSDTLIYRTNSQLNNNKNDVYVNINSVELQKNAILDSTSITKNKLPWFYFDYKEFNCQLGKDLVKTDIEQYIREYLNEESINSGLFYTTSPKDELSNELSLYNVDIEIEKLDASGTFLFAGEQSHTAYPAKAFCIINLQLSKNGKTVLSKKITKTNFTKKESKVKYTNIKSLNSEELQTKYATSMISALSNSINQSLVEIVSSINQYISSNE